VAPGSAANFNLTLTPTGTTFPDAITFSVTGLPTGATATTTSARNEQPASGNPLAPVALGFLLLPLLGLKAARERLLRRQCDSGGNYTGGAELRRASDRDGRDDQGAEHDEPDAYCAITLRCAQATARAQPIFQKSWMSAQAGIQFFFCHRRGTGSPTTNITGNIFRQRRGRSVYRHGRIDGPRRRLKMGWIEPLAGTGSMGVESWGGV
jgi:hypothetical protein